MIISPHRLCLVYFILSWSYVSAADFALPEKLPEHPRLYFTKQKEAEIKELMKTDSFLEKLVAELIKKADKVKDQAPSKYAIPDGKRLLAQSRRSLERTTALAFAYRMTGNQEYADVAITEMLTVCRFKDWNPSHYLDTAEMATAVALGYDWLYGVIPAEQREEIKQGLIRHALKTGLEVYETNGWWATTSNNWNEVCNAGLTIAALAIADEERAMAESIVDYSLKSFPRGLSVYKPDGAYPEGPMYWAYGTSFTGLKLMIHQDVLRDDFGLLATEGLKTTGDYYMSMVGPKYLFYNYADSVLVAEAAPMMFALSHLYDRPDYAAWLRTFVEKENQYQVGRLAVFYALWYNSKGTTEDFVTMPLAQKFSGIQDVCTMRTAWNDPNAAFLAFKGGNNRAGHGHLDIGSFVYEVNGIRWAVDLGIENYNLPDYFGSKRWTYYRLINQSHNTLVIGDKIQNTAANCKIVRFNINKELKIGRERTNAEYAIASATADITEAYKGQVQSAKRKVTLYERGSVMITDELEGVTEPVRWGMMTQADIELDAGGKRARLSQGEQQITFSLISQEAEKFEIVSTKPPTEAENQNKGYSMLAIVAVPQEGKVSIGIHVTPRSL